MSEIAEHLKARVAEVRFARLIVEIVWALGAFASAAGLVFRVLLLTVMGFPLLFVGLYLSVHYELQRVDYTLALEKLAHQEK